MPVINQQSNYVTKNTENSLYTFWSFVKGRLPERAHGLGSECVRLYVETGKNINDFLIIFYTMLFYHTLSLYFSFDKSQAKLSAR